MLHLVSLALAAAALGQPGSDRSAAPGAEQVMALETAIAEAIARAEPSVVAIAREKGESEETTAIRGRTSNRDQDDRPPAEVPGEQDPDQLALTSDYGSGVVIGDEGQIVTAYHVVDGAKRIIVRAAGRQKFLAEIIAADPRSDLAVIMPMNGRGKPAPELKPLPLGDASRLRKGSFLIALGNSFAAARDGNASASWGILSNTARRLERAPDDMSEGRQLRHHPTLLQLDTKLNLGMSGGAVVNLKGELVGITTATTSARGFDAQAGYAIPVDPLIRRVIDSLRQGKEAEYGFLGIVLDPNGTSLVGTAQPGTPAGEGGLSTGDLITEVGGIRVTDSDSLVLAINTMPVGVPITLKIVRDNEVLEKKLALAKYPVEGHVIATNRHAPWRGIRVDYTSTLLNRSRTFDDNTKSAMAIGGVRVVDVAAGTAAEEAGLHPDQIIIKVDDQVVRTPDQFYKATAGRNGPVKVSTNLGELVVK